jgi:uncharacterized protein
MAESPLMSRYMLSTLAGLQFSGKRDLYEVFGYKKALTYDDLYAKYRRQDIATRVVDEPVKAIWARPPEIKNEAINKVMIELNRKFDLWQTFARADKLCAFGEFSILLLGVRGDPAQPVRALPTTAQRELLYVQPYGTKQATIDKLDDNPRSPRFGLPEMYKVDIGSTNANDTNSTVTTKQIKVHYSRIIHITDPLLVENYRAPPRLEKVYNVLDDLLKVGGGSAETYWLTATRGMQVNIDKEMDLTPDDEAALTEELDEFQHQLRRYIRTRGVEIKDLGNQVTDPQGTFNVLLKLLSSATGIPQRILMGAEAGQLASEQDRANWANQIEARRAEFAEPYIIRPFVQKMSDLGMIPATGGEEQIELVWPEAFRMSPLERAQEMAQKARSVVNLSRQTIAGHPIVTTQEAREILGLAPNEELPPVEDGVELAWLSKGLDPETGETVTPEDTTEGGGDSTSEGDSEDGQNGQGQGQEPGQSPGQGQGQGSQTRSSLRSVLLYKRSHLA